MDRLDRFKRTEEKGLAEMNKVRLGILLAGGAGTRMYPLTQAVTKQLLPVYDKPMIYYPLTTLMQAGIRRVVIVSQKENLALYSNLFGDGKSLGMEVGYAEQSEPRGIADAFLVAELWVRKSARTCLILGDNIFHCPTLSRLTAKAARTDNLSATIFLMRVRDPERYGVAIMSGKKVLRIVEKPERPESDLAVTGLYFYPSEPLMEQVRQLKPSARGELEITDLNNRFLESRKLEAIELPAGAAWLDSGKPDALLSAAHYIHTIQERQGILVGSPHAQAYTNGWISSEQLRRLAEQFPNDYGCNLLLLADRWPGANSIA